VQIEQAATYAGAYSILGTSQNCTADGSYSTWVQPAATNAYIRLRVTAITGALNYIIATLNAFGETPVAPAMTFGALTSTTSTGTSTDNEVFIPATTAGCLVTPTTATVASPQLYVRAALNNTVYSVTTNAAAGSFEIDCDLAQGLATRLTGGKGLSITAINVLYGMQNVVPTSIADAIFGTITYPAVGGAASGTVTQPLASTVTPGISHSTPVATTSGQCYKEGNVLTVPLVFTSLIPRLTYSQVFSQTAASATVVQVCGFQVLYNWIN